MTSPTTVVGVPLTGLPMIEEAIVVVLHGWPSAGFLPTSAAGASYVPLVGGDQVGKRMPPALAMASEAATSTAAAPTIRRFVFDMRRLLGGVCPGWAACGGL